MLKPLAILAAALALSATAASAQPGKQVDDISLELVGQVVNSAPGVVPATSVQYGYVAYLRGLSIFSADPQNETTALFTFSIQTTTLRVIANGPLRIISREGTMTVYRRSAPGADFANPDSFRSGTPVLVAGLRQQVILNTATNSFTATNASTIVSSSPFPAGDGQLRLGEPGQRFRTLINGQANATAAPSAWMAGYTLTLGR